MKKVGLVTCFLGNYGACLQAFALQEQIKKLGCECKILPYIGPDGYLRDDLTMISKMRLRVLARDILSIGKKDRPYDWRKSHLSFYNFRKKHLDFDQSIPLCYHAEELEAVADRYDAFVCGSDQIWNPTFYKCNNPVYFLRFAKDKKRIAYAPSIGLSQIPGAYREEFVAYIRDFDSVSVREQQGAQIVRDLCDRDAHVVLDPTLLAGPDFWNATLTPNYPLPFEKYIFSYIFSDTEQSRNYLKQVQEQTGLPIVYLNIGKLTYEGLNAYRKDYADPLDFLQLIKHAQFLVTDSFHGTAFSLLFNKDLYVFKREHTGEKIDMLSRLESILSYAGLQDRFVSLDQPFVPKDPIDYAPVNEKLAVLRADSETYLKNALFGE